jgi:hypothetical protein
MRFASFTRSKQEREEQRMEKKRAKMELARRKLGASAPRPLSPVVDDQFWTTGRYTQFREQLAYVAF